MKFNFENKVVLITGASRGVGAATAKIFAELGATIAIHYKQNKEKAEEVLNSLTGENHRLFQVDLEEKKSGFNLVEQVVEHFDRIDVLVNNAGIYQELLLESAKEEEWLDNWERTININLRAAAHLSFQAIRYMRKTGGGKIINVSSRGAFRGEPTAHAYGAAKAGLNSFGQSLAVSVARDNIFVYTVAPGFIETDMVQYILESEQADDFKNQSPLGRFSRPEEIAETIAYLASEGTAYLTGGIIDINGASYLRS